MNSLWSPLCIVFCSVEKSAPHSQALCLLLQSRLLSVRRACGSQKLIGCHAFCKRAKRLANLLQAVGNKRQLPAVPFVSTFAQLAGGSQKEIVSMEFRRFIQFVEETINDFLIRYYFDVSNDNKSLISISRPSQISRR